MISANELRIGNLVYDTRGVGDIDRTGWPELLSPYRIRKVDGGEIYDYLKPIPLTPEILEKCGFAKQEDHGFWNNQEYDFYYCDGMWISAKNNEYRLFVNSEDDFYSNHLIEVKFIHHLQNLYFAFVGKEMEVTL